MIKFPINFFKVFNKFCISFLLVTLIIFFIETFVRAYIVDPSLVDKWGYNLAGYGDLLPNRNFVAEIVPELPYRVVTNSQGLRNEISFKLPKPSGMFRILALGDSFTFGPYVHNHETYPAQLEKELKYMGVKAEVINAGVSGYTLVDELEYLMEKGIKLQPDLVIIGVYENDVADYLENRRSRFARSKLKAQSLKFPIIYSLLRKSAVAFYLQQLLLKQQTNVIRSQVDSEPKTEVTQDNELKKYKDDLEALLNIAYKQNIKLLFVFFPHENQLDPESKYFPQAEIINTIRQKNEYVDLLPVFRQHSVEDLYLMPRNNHLSAFGNSITAKTSAAIINKGL